MYYYYNFSTQKKSILLSDMLVKVGWKGARKNFGKANLTLAGTIYYTSIAKSSNGSQQTAAHNNFPDSAMCSR